MNSRRHSPGVVVAVLALAAPAAASPLDILGLGSRHAGQANAGIANVDDASALYYNPAGLANHARCVRWSEPAGDGDESRGHRDDDESDDRPRAHRDDDSDDKPRGHRDDDESDDRPRAHRDDDSDDKPRGHRDDEDGTPRGHRGPDASADDARHRKPDASDDERHRGPDVSDDESRGPDTSDDKSRHRGPNAERRHRDDDRSERHARDESPDPICVERDRGDLLLGVVGGYSHLAIDNVRAPFADAGGAQLAARARIGERFAFAFAFHGPSQGGEHAVVRDPEYPLYPYYRDRLSRPVLLVGAAANLGVASLGGAADLGAGTAHPKAILGGTYRVSEALRLGLAYHQRFAIVDEATGARVHYTPHTALAGVTFTNDAVRASLDVGFAHWSAYSGPFATGTSTRVFYSSSEIVRFGIESNKEDGVSFRFGYALETASIPDQQTDSHLLDGTKQLVAGGASYGVGRVRVDGHIGLQIVSTRTMENPDGTMLKSGGEVFTGGLTLALGY